MCVLQFAQCNALQIPSAMLIIRYVYHRAFEEYRVISKHSDFAHVLGPPFFSQRWKSREMHFRVPRVVPP